MTIGLPIFEVITEQCFGRYAVAAEREDAPFLRVFDDLFVNRTR
jgi:hypothetical protein